jgi:transcriptional regulator with XRE-family HTH domain
MSVYVIYSIRLIFLRVRRTLSQKFGKCVRELRQERNLSQVEFGERCGFYQTYLSRIENGQANPTLNAMEVIANALGLTIFDLFDRIRAEGTKRRR